MADQGLDTWILEFRGVGLNMQGLNSKRIKQSANAISQQIKAAASATNGSFSANQQSNISTGAELSMLGLNSKEFEQSTNVLYD